MILASYSVLPSWHIVLLLYYMVGWVVFAAGIAYVCATISVFSADLGHVVGTLSTLWFWATPIVWPISILSPTLQEILPINPMYVVVEGYRRALIPELGGAALSFSDLMLLPTGLVLLALGLFFFGRLRPHFADVM